MTVAQVGLPHPDFQDLHRAIGDTYPSVCIVSGPPLCALPQSEWSATGIETISICSCIVTPALTGTPSSMHSRLPAVGTQSQCRSPMLSLAQSLLDKTAGVFSGVPAGHSVCESGALQPLRADAALESSTADHVQLAGPPVPGETALCLFPVHNTQQTCLCLSCGKGTPF